MISYIRGKLQEIYEESLIVETGGIGYQIQVPFSLLQSASVGREIQVIHIFTWGRIRYRNSMDSLPERIWMYLSF